MARRFNKLNDYRKRFIEGLKLTINSKDRSYKIHCLPKEIPIIKELIRESSLSMREEHE